MNANTIPLAVINPDAPADSLEAKQPHIDNGTECYARRGISAASTWPANGNACGRAAG